MSTRRRNLNSGKLITPPRCNPTDVRYRVCLPIAAVQTPSDQGVELTNSCEASLSVGRRCCDCTESRVSVMIGEGLKSVCCPPTCSCAARNGFDGESLGLNLCWLFGERIAGDRPPGEPFLGLRKGLLEDRLRLRPGEGRRSGTVWRESSYQ